MRREVFVAVFKESILECCDFADMTVKKSSFVSCKVYECLFKQVNLSESKFTNCDLKKSTFHLCDLSKCDFTDATNYLIDPRTNNIKKARFSMPEAVRLLESLDIVLS